MNIEKRTFIKEDKYNELIAFFDAEAVRREVEKQIIYSYHTEGDFRVIRTKEYVKMELKTANVNEEDNVVLIHNKYDNQLLDMFYKLGIAVDLKRFRIRNKYMYQNLYITIDNNLKYGYVFRVKATYNTLEDRELKSLLVNRIYNQFNLVETSKEQFSERFRSYRTDWVQLTSEINDDDFLNN